MKLFRKRKKLNNKGLSLVELVCAVAIFGLATTAIGGAMVVSAQNYSRGTYELDVQQEAQTTTNLIGDLLFDATNATFVNSGDPVLTIDGENVKYQITYKTTEEKLVYKEIRSGGESTGTLAENVKGFTVDLDETGAKFAANKNVDVTLKVEKNGRVYETKYSTTARNGAAISSGVEDTAAIVVEENIVLEPNQTYLLPYEVVGSIANKSISIMSVDTGLSVMQSGDNLAVTASYKASGTLSFTVKTDEWQKDDEGNNTTVPMATKTVFVNIRRVNSITSPMDGDNDGYADGNYWKNNVLGKTNFQQGTEYRIEFNVNADSPNKQYGKAYDMDYVNPFQVDISYSMVGGNIADYIEYAQTNLVDNPYIILKLKNDMPSGAEIVVTATAKHPEGVNKSGERYGIPSDKNASVIDVVRIKNEAKLLWPKSDLSRGVDGVEILMAGAEVDRLMALYGTNSYTKEYSVYEVTYKSDGTIESMNGPMFTAPMSDNGSYTHINAAESMRLKPDLDYIIEMKIVFNLPSGEKKIHSANYPLDRVTLTYDYQTNAVKQGTEGNPYEMTIGQSDTSNWLNVQGLAMTKYGKDEIAFKIEKKDSSGVYQPFTASDLEFKCENTDWDSETGRQSEYHINMKMKIGDQNLKSTYLSYNSATGEYDPGEYRILPYLDTIPYNNYDGTAATPGNFDLYNISNDEGIFYIKLNDVN